MADIRIYHSFRSPYSRLGLHIIDRANLEVELIPFSGPPEGSAFNDPVANAPKLEYYRLDVPRMTMRMGLPIIPPNPFDVDLVPSYKAAVGADRDGFGMAYALSVSDARWGEGKNISEISVLRECATKVGWSADAAEKAQSDLSVGKMMKTHRDMIEADKVFGVPFAVMGDSKYWGHDRFDLLVEETQR